MKHRIVIGITQGDTNGVGYETIIKVLSNANILEMFTPVIYGSPKFFGYYRKLVHNTENINVNVIHSARDANPKMVNIVSCIPDELTVTPGKLTLDGSLAAVASLETAVREIKGGLTDILVTLPINKRGMADVHFKYPGHTGYLTDVFGVPDSLMFMCSDVLRIGVVTDHIPLRDVASSLSKERILSKLRIMNDSLKKDFGIVKPKIAVLGLNPHAGDNGLIGSEEAEIIEPAVKEARSENIGAFGPLPPGGFFAVALQREYDGVLAMYHDQGMIPFKSVAFDSGVNYTAGLPFVRTSPDHGTAFGIAGTGKAHPGSTLSSIFLAIDIYRNRRRYAEITADPLPKQEETSSENDSSIDTSYEEGI